MQRWKHNNGMKSTKREVVARSGSIVIGLLLAGCVTTPAGDETEPQTMDEACTGTNGDTERLPERSPLSNPLPGLVEAEDRQAYADEQGLEVRDCQVKVEIELEPDGERPDEYLVETVDRYGRILVAWVEIDDLVDLALDENVRRVQPPTEPEGA